MKFKVRIIDFPIILLFAAAVVFSAWKIFGTKAESKTLIVQIQSEKYAYALDRELHLEFEGLIGKSHVTVSGGEAWFEDSPCDNKICVDSGKISRSNQWAACLPNGIIIYVEGKAESNQLDAIAN